MPPATRRPTLTRVPGVRAGHAHDALGRSGVTVLRFAQPTPTAVDVRGGASATYDTASLGLEATYGRRWGLFFAGGSIFGLDAARGLRECILEDGEGHPAFERGRRIAPVSGAALFDLPPDGTALPDYAVLGHAAARAASERPLASGRVGAGAGATVAKYRGRSSARPGGIGSVAASTEDGMVGVVAVANSVGAIRDPFRGRWIAAARDRNGRLLLPDARVPPPARRSSPGPGTNLVAVVTDASIDRPGLFRVAVLAHTGLSRAVVPVHTATDGDVVFASSTGSPAGPRRTEAPGALADRIGGLAARLVAEALLRAVGAG